MTRTKTAIESFFRGDFLSQIWKWLPTISKFLTMEVLVQFLSIATSLLVIRCLSKTDYAFYSVAYGFQGSLAIFSLTGISTGLTSIAAQARSPSELRQVLVTAARMRITLVAFGLLFALPCFAYILSELGCDWQLTSFLLGLAVGILLTAIQTQMLTLPLKLDGNYMTPQLELLISAALRLCLVFGLTLIGFATAGPVMLAGAISSGVGMLYLKARERRFSLNDTKQFDDVSKKLIAHFWVGLPSSLTYLLESQFAIVLISFMGGVSEVADLGALSRIALIFSIPTAVINGILVPRLAKEQSPILLKRIWLRSFSLSIVAGSAIFLVIFYFSSVLLWILGTQYSQLTFELRSIAALQAFIFAMGVLQSPIIARGWVRLSWLRPFFCFGFQFVALAFLDLGTVNGAICLMASGALGNSTLNCILLYQGWRGNGDLYQNPPALPQ